MNSFYYVLKYQQNVFLYCFKYMGMDIGVGSVIEAMCKMREKSKNNIANRMHNTYNAQHQPVYCKYNWRQFTLAAPQNKKLKPRE